MQTTGNKTIEYLAKESEDLRLDLDEKTQIIKQLEREITILRSTNYNTLNLIQNNQSSNVTTEEVEDQSSPFFSNQPSLGQTLKA